MCRVVERFAWGFLGCQHNTVRIIVPDEGVFESQRFTLYACYALILPCIFFFTHNNKKVVFFRCLLIHIACTYSRCLCGFIEDGRKNYLIFDAESMMPYFNGVPCIMYLLIPHCTTCVLMLNKLIQIEIIELQFLCSLPIFLFQWRILYLLLLNGRYVR